MYSDPESNRIEGVESSDSLSILVSLNKLFEQKFKTITVLSLQRKQKHITRHTTWKSEVSQAPSWKSGISQTCTTFAFSISPIPLANDYSLPSKSEKNRI
uniref:Uncharacterized protein n=1 Tax=Homalodisca liturata TaxID=320908 RepID=A0A1B6JFE5_9HEMI